MTSEPAEPLRDVVARHGLQASKALGQNFILDRRLLARIAAVPGSLEYPRPVMPAGLSEDQQDALLDKMMGALLR